MTDYSFSHPRGDQRNYPFTVTLANPTRSLDGTEGWRFSLRASKTGPLLLEMSTDNGGISRNSVTFQPEINFVESSFENGNFTNRDDAEFFYDLEMTKDGITETVIVSGTKDSNGQLDRAIFTLVGDVSQ